MYNRRFIFEECGFNWIPPHINRDLLFNVSYDVTTGEVKLYILNEARNSLFKISRAGIAIQHEATTPADSAPLADFLPGHSFDQRDVTLDTVEGDTYYVLIEGCQSSTYVKFLDLICLKYGFSKSQLIGRVNQINRRQVGNIFECMQHRAISMVRIPLRTRACKIYARPFRTGNGFDFNARTIDFLTRLYDSAPTADHPHLRDCWTSADMDSERIVITTQYDTLLYPDAVPAFRTVPDGA